MDLWHRALRDLPDNFFVNLKTGATKVAVSPNGCWVWRGSLSRGGYGLYGARQPGGGFQTVTAHRFAYEALIAPLPSWDRGSGHCLDHLCRERCCVNPEHLEVVTQKVNIGRGLRVDLKQACANGHPWVAENIYVQKAGGHKGVDSRTCLICRRESLRASMARQRAREIAAKRWTCGDCGAVVGKKGRRCRTCGQAERRRAEAEEKRAVTTN